LVDKLHKKLDTSCNEGVSGISTKILKAHSELALSVTDFSINVLKQRQFLMNGN
jgi:hypothetical protein